MTNFTPNEKKVHYIKIMNNIQFDKKYNCRMILHISPETRLITLHAILSIYHEKFLLSNIQSSKILLTIYECFILYVT